MMTQQQTAPDGVKGTDRTTRAEVQLRWTRAVLLSIAFSMALSAVVHLETLFVWEVGYVARFPEWYSAAIIPAQLAMLSFGARLRPVAAPVVRR